MVLFFNRKKLLTDVSQVECNRVKQILKEEKIEFYYRTTKSAPMTSRMSDVSAGASYGLPYSSKKDNTTFVYMIYVKRKDYKRARQLAYHK